MLDLAVIVFTHAEGADHADVSYDEEGDLIGKRIAEGALTGAVAGNPRAVR